MQETNNIERQKDSQREDEIRRKKRVYNSVQINMKFKKEKGKHYSDESEKVK